MLLSGCGYSNVASESFESMDTFMKIDIYGSADTAAEIRTEIESLDSLLSAQDDSSEIGRLNKNGSAELSEDTADLLTQALELCADTDGALDISVYPLVEAWGFIDKNYRIPGESEIDDLLKNTENHPLRRQGLSRERNEARPRSRSEGLRRGQGGRYYE